MLLSRAQLQSCKRWLPIAVLLLALAQLASVSHWHPDNHSLVDCSLCLQQSNQQDLHSGHSLSLLLITGTGPAIAARPTTAPHRPLPTPAIRGPPANSLS